MFLQSNVAKTARYIVTVKCHQCMFCLLYSATKMLCLFTVYSQVNGEDVQGLSHAKVIGMLRKITGTVELEIKRYFLYM